MIRVLIVYDHAVVRDGIAHGLEPVSYQVVSQAASVAEAIAQISLTSPELVIVDLNLPDGSGFEIIQWIRNISKETVIIIFTLASGPESLRAAIKSGANGFVLKSSTMPELLATISHCLKSPGSFTAKNLNLLNDKNSETLTARELVVLHKMSDGYSNQDIATQLFLSKSTVKTHVSSIFRKLEVGNRVSAVKFAREKNLLVE